MTLRRQAERAWGIVRSQGLRWVAERLVLEAQKRSGYEARLYAPRPWRGANWIEVLRASSRDRSPHELLADWREGAGHAWGRARREPDWQQALAASLARDAASDASQEGAASSSRSSRTSKEALLARAEAILAGHFTLFSRHQAEMRFPPDWDGNPLRGSASRPPANFGSTGRHWSRIGMEGAPYGDLKFVWELSRAAWAFILARAYVATQEERFAEGFWQLWEDWIETHPPHQSVQWKCGQECALRLMAVSFAVQMCAPAQATTPKRFARHLEAMADHAGRIARGGWYARLQNNNHSMSEAAGLFTAGVFYPMLEDAETWRALGWRHLNEEAVRLLRVDGTFVQKSHNYHRLMLHDYLWANSVAESAGTAGRDGRGGETWTPEARARLTAAIDYLEGVVDPISGGAPNFGPNDGALILELDEATYSDFRPVLRAATFWRDGSNGVPSEGSLWLFGPRAIEAPTERVKADASLSRPSRSLPPTLACAEGGIYTLHQGESWIFTHAEDLRDRPGQADLLHVDLWWRGCAIARDAGTFLYYGDPKAFAWFKGSRCHNTVTVDDLDQMEPGPRFLWASRAHARARALPASEHAQDPGDRHAGAALFMSHDGYQRLPAPVTHERTVRALGEDAWLVADELGPHGAVLAGSAVSGDHTFTLHWLLADTPHAWLGSPADIATGTHGLALATPAGPFYVQVLCLSDGAATVELVRASEGPDLAGWQSLHYGEKTPALSLRLRARGTRARFLTLFSPHAPTRPLSATAWLDDDHPPP